MIDTGRDTLTNPVSDTGLQRFAAALVGLILGQVTGDKSITIAKAVLYLWNDGKSYERETVAEASLAVLFIFACVGIIFGAFATRRKWASFEQVVMSMVVVVIVAFFTIVDHSLPNAVGDSRLPFWETMYYLGWVITLWFLPVILLPNPDATFPGWVRRGGVVLAVSATMAGACWAVGGILELAAGYIFNVSLSFWMARPVTINAICGAFVAVTFVGIWWRGLWWSAISPFIWLIGMTILVIAYTGVYGWFFYAPGKVAPPWQFFLTFSAFPTVVAATVLVAYKLTRRRDNVGFSVGWPVSRWFWRLLPVGFAFGFALIAWLGFASLAQHDETINLVIAHSLNGILLGLSLRVMELALRLIPEH